MITGLLLSFIHALAVALFAWLGSSLPDAPSFWSDGVAALDAMVGSVGEPVRWFLPIGPALGFGVGYSALLVVLGALRLARRVLSLMTGGGGA